MEQLSRSISPVLQWAYRRSRLFPAITDALAWIAALGCAALLRIANSTEVAIFELAVLTCLAVAAQLAIGSASGLYRSRWRITSFEEVSALSLTWLTSSLLVLVAGRLVTDSVLGAPRFSVIVATGLAMSAMIATRAGWRRFWELHRRPRADAAKRTIVFGAGEGGTQIVKAMLSDPQSAYYPVALLDDDLGLRNRRIGNAVVEGTRYELPTVAARHDAQVLLVAITGATSTLIQDASRLARDAGLEVRVLPATSELVGKMTMADVRQPTVDDLLGRDPVEIDLDSVAGYIRDKRVLVTGAGGSIGSELSRQINEFGPAELYLLDRDETALHSLQLSMEGRALLDTDRLIVADIRDEDRMIEIFEACQPQVVFHTAALKHLTLLENHPVEGVKTNLLGTRNLLSAATKFGVERFVNVSTDKAADPTSVLGATKLGAERLTARAASETDKPYLSVRFGNVLGSRGSVLPTFLRQIEKGHNLTVTDPDATRFFMTIPEAVRLVVQAGAIGKPGEVLILDMGEPVKILDLARQLRDLLNPAVEIEFTGLRPGEKLHEVLTAQDEIGVARVHPRIIHTASDLADPIDALQGIDPRAIELAQQNLGLRWATSQCFDLSKMGELHERT